MPDLGFGATLVIGGFTVTDMTEVGAPGWTADTVESTNHSNSDYFKTYVKGLIDAGSIPISGYLSYANANTCTVLVETRTLQSVTVIFPTTPSRTQFACSGHMTKFETSAPVDGLMEFSAEIQVSGKPTLSKVV